MQSFVDRLDIKNHYRNHRRKEEQKKMINIDMKELSLNEGREINGGFSIPVIVTVTGNYRDIKIVKSITEWLAR